MLQHVSSKLLDSRPMHVIPDQEEYTKTLGVAWNSNLDQFRLTVADLPQPEKVTKRLLVSDIAKTFDVLGWFAPSKLKSYGNRRSIGMTTHS